MDRPRIVIFIDWYLPAFKAGGPVKSVASIAQVFKNDLDIYIITSDRDFGDNSPFENVILDQWTTVNDTKVIYLSPENQNADRYQELIKEIQPKKVYLNSLFSKNFTLTPLKMISSEFPTTEVIIAPRGMLGAGALKIKRTKKQIFLKMARLLKWFKNVTWHASTEQELQEIKQHFGTKAQVKIAENLGTVPNIIKRIGKVQKGRLNMLFVSRVSTKKNLFFILECMNTPELKDLVSLSIVGPIEEEEYGQKCADYIKSNKLNAEFLGGKSPDELSSLYASHDLFILPTHHENYGHVIIEALGHGTPVIISENTPWRNLKNSGVGFDLPLDIDQFREKIDKFAQMGNEEWMSYSKSASEYARNKINSESAITANRNLFLS